jgi:hypothetical protein
VTLMIGECIARYKQHARGYYVKNGRETSEVHFVHSALQPLVDRFKDLPVSEFGPKRLKQVREDTIKLGWCRSTVKRAVNVVQGCFSWCASEELIDANVAVRSTLVCRIGSWTN